MQIICCGNSDRGDDGAGLLVAQQLRALGIKAEVQPGDALDLIESWDESEEVIVVDATATGTQPGNVQVWDGKVPQKIVSAAGPSHGLGVGEAVYLAEILHRLPRRLRIYGIEGKQFGLGEEISPEVRKAAERVAKEIAEQIVVRSQ